jgi:hypothetical protein
MGQASLSEARERHDLGKCIDAYQGLYDTVRNETINRRSAVEPPRNGLSVNLGEWSCRQSAASLAE